MPSASQWLFGPFRLDVANACLWRGDELLPIRPKPFAVLAHLVAHAGQLVTKEALFEAIWPDTVVSDAVLKSHIRRIRQALGDTAQTSQFVATVHRRGYRFIAPVVAADEPVAARLETSPPTDPAGSLPATLPTPTHRPPCLSNGSPCYVSSTAGWRKPPAGGAESRPPVAAPG